MFSLFPSREVALEILGFDIHWYGLMYLCGFLGGYLLLPRLQHYRGVSWSSDQWSTVLSWAVVGVIVGGRLGYVFFYAPMYFASNPLEIFAVWGGGMSSHGGFIGVTLAMYYVSRKYSTSLLILADIVIVPIAIGLAFGRFGNFINQELYGTVSTVPWAMHIPGVDGARHPTHLYAVAKDLLIALVCFLHLSRVFNTRGQTLSIFLIMYAVLRFIVEIFRVQDHSSVEIGLVSLSRGQFLTLPIVLVGLGLLYYSIQYSKGR